MFSVVRPVDCYALHRCPSAISSRGVICHLTEWAAMLDRSETYHEQHILSQFSCERCSPRPRNCRGPDQSAGWPCGPDISPFSPFRPSWPLSLTHHTRGKWGLTRTRQSLRGVRTLLQLLQLILEHHRSVRHQHHRKMMDGIPMAQN